LTHIDILVFENYYKLNKGCLPQTQPAQAPILQTSQSSPQDSPFSSTPSLPSEASEKEVQSDVDQKLKEEQDRRRVLANQARSKKKQNHLDRILELARNINLCLCGRASLIVHESR